jgi:hypothetical protein
MAKPGTIHQQADIMKDFFSQRDDFLADGGWHGPRFGAFKQGAAQNFLQNRNLRRKRWLRNAQTAGGPAKAARFRHLQKIADLFDPGFAMRLFFCDSQS